MENFEDFVERYINAGIDIAVHILNEKRLLPPYSFLINHDGNLQTVIPNEADFLFEDHVIIDYFKDFGNQKISENLNAGFCVIYNSKINKGTGISDAITLFFKFKNDTLPLKTRVYYFPYFFQNQKPYINFELAFSSEG